MLFFKTIQVLICSQSFTLWGAVSTSFFRESRFPILEPSRYRYDQPCDRRL